MDRFPRKKDDIFHANRRSRAIRKYKVKMTKPSKQANKSVVNIHVIIIRKSGVKALIYICEASK